LKTLLRLPVSMKFLAVVLLAALGMVAAAPLAQASDATLKRALKAYEGRLTADIGYLSSFSVPSKGTAAGVLRRLSKVRTDLTGAARAANHEQASSSSGRRGRALVLSGLHDASAAAGDARACANAAGAGNRSAAARDRRLERREIGKAIPLFESGGRLLHLF
jgi:hypothetical protein